MNAFSKRYFVWIALIFIVFSMLSFKFGAFAFLFIFCAAVTAIYLLFRKFCRKRQNLNIIFALAICAALVGVINTQVLLFKNESRVEKYSGEREVSGFVLEVASYESYCSELVVRIEEIDGERVAFDAILVADFQTDLYRGDFFKCKGTFTSLDRVETFSYLRNRNIYDYPLALQLSEQDGIEYLEKEWRIRPMLSDLNSRLSATLKANMTKRSGSLASALLLGNRELLSDDALRDFKRAGVYHMLALSGMHVAILVGILEYILKKLFVPMKLRIVLLGALSLFYVALTGFLLSACRAMLMLFVMYLSLALGKRRDSLTALFVAATVICLISPAAILDVGFQLSLLSTLGIIAASMIRAQLKLFKREIRARHRIVKSIALALRETLFLLMSSLCVFVCTLPAVTVYFGEVSLATFFTNLFMGIVCECFMVLALLTLCFTKIGILGGAFAALSDAVGVAMTSAVSWVSGFEGVMLSLRYPHTELIVWILFFASLFLFAVKVRRKWLISIPCIVFAVVFSANAIAYALAREGSVRAEFILGDELVLSTADGVYICDFSDGRYGNLYEGVELARENCQTEIEGIVLTHYHRNHAIAIERLSKTCKIHSALVPMPRTYDEGVVMRSIVRVLEDQGVPVYVYGALDELSILGGSLCVSDRAYILSSTHPSVALSYAYGEQRITVVERPYFDTYLEESGQFSRYISESDYLIFGSDGRAPGESFEIFSCLREGCEVSFTDFDMMNMSDFDEYLDKMDIYFDVGYKKYDLK